MPRPPAPLRRALASPRIRVGRRAGAVTLAVGIALAAGIAFIAPSSGPGDGDRPAPTAPGKPQIGPTDTPVPYTKWGDEMPPPVPPVRDCPMSAEACEAAQQTLVAIRNADADTIAASLAPFDDGSLVTGKAPDRRTSVEGLRGYLRAIAADGSGAVAVGCPVTGRLLGGDEADCSRGFFLAVDVGRDSDGLPQALVIYLRRDGENFRPLHAWVQRHLDVRRGGGSATNYVPLSDDVAGGLAIWYWPWER